MYTILVENMDEKQRAEFDEDLKVVTTEDIQQRRQDERTERRMLAAKYGT